MGTYAASGGYYISCGASRIVAEPTTLTGSIGVFGLIPCINKLLTQTLGITSDEVKTNRFGNLSIVTPLTEAEGRMIQNSVEQTYALFLDRCAAGRRMPVDSIARIAEGRVWTGADAIKLGLVDELGGLQTALDAAAKLADVKKYSIETYPVQKSFFEELLESFGSDNLEAKLAAELGINKQSLKLLQHITKQDPIQARMTDITVR
jgi:protease-4